MSEASTPSALDARVAGFTEALREAGFETTLRQIDYGVKLALRDGDRPLGHAVVYHRPAKGTFRLVLNEIDVPEVAERVQAAWDGPTLLPHGEAGTATTGPDGLVAYVDGSFRDGVAAYGFVVVDGGLAVHEASGRVEGSTSTQNVAGEVEAVCRLLEWADQGDVTHLTIAYDYKGLECWATGKWEARSAPACQLVSAVRASRTELAWRKVAAHTGDRWNERADSLARAALEGPVEPSTPDPASALVTAFERLRAMVPDLDLTLKVSPNPYHARVLIGTSGGADLYANRRGVVRLEPGSLKNPEIRERIRREWDSTPIATGPPPDPLERTRYALSRLAPYSAERVSTRPLSIALAADLRDLLSRSGLPDEVQASLEVALDLPSPPTFAALRDVADAVASLVGALSPSAQ